MKVAPPLMVKRLTTNAVYAAAAPLFDIAGKVGVIVLTNAQDGDAGGISTQLMNTVGQAVAKATREAPAQVKWNPAWSPFAGLYRGRGGDSHVVELHEKLVIINPDAANLDNPIELVPIGDGTFRYTAPAGGGVIGEIVRFVEENGQVVRMYPATVLWTACADRQAPSGLNQVGSLSIAAPLALKRYLPWAVSASSTSSVRS